MAFLFTRKLADRDKPSRNLVIEGEEVQWSDVVRYLGVQLDKKMVFAAHVQSLVEKSEKVLRCLSPLINRCSRLDVANRLRLFKTVHRPTFTYGAPLLSRCARTHKKKLQIHQNRVLKMMLDKPRRFLPLVCILWQALR